MEQENLTVDTFKVEIDKALDAYRKYIICIDKTPDEFEEIVQRLVGKAIKAFLSRKPDQRHGIALDNQITVIISENNGERPLCGIYFNLYSPHAKKKQTRAAG